MSKPTFNRIARQHITEANRSTSMTKFVGANGEINATDKRDLLRAMAELANRISEDDIFTDVSHGQLNSAGKTSREVAAENSAILREAYHDRSGSSWAELGSGIALELQTRNEREGFMRRVLARANVAEGSVPRIRIKVPNVRAVVARGVGQNWPQFVRDKFIVVDEFEISVNVRVPEIDMHQGSANILEDKFYESQEAISVQEDKVVKNLMDATVGVYNNPTYYSGAFTPTLFQALRYNISRWRLPVGHFIFSGDIINDFLVGSDFINFYDPISRYEMIQNGMIGSFFGSEFITDGFREANLRVLNDGEIYATSLPEYNGGYTDRGPVTSVPVDSYADGIAARGWFMVEFISAVWGNAKTAAKAKRT